MGAVDTQAIDEAILESVKAMATPDARIVLAYVVPVDGTQAAMGQARPDPEGIRKRRIDAAHRTLSGAAQGMRRFNVTSIAREGHISPTLVQIAREAKAQLIVAGAHRPQPNRLQSLGSVARSLLELSDRPVLIARRTLDAKRRRPLSIVVATDFTAADRMAREWVRTYEASVPCRVHLVHVVDPNLWWEGRVAPHVAAKGEPRPTWSSIQEGRRKELATAAESFGKQARSHLLIGAPRNEILGFLQREDADLLVVGRSSRSGSLMPIGSVAYDLADSAPCSVLVWPPGP